MFLILLISHSELIIKHKFEICCLFTLSVPISIVNSKKKYLQGVVLKISKLGLGNECECCLLQISPGSVSGPEDHFKGHTEHK